VVIAVNGIIEEDYGQISLLRRQTEIPFERNADLFARTGMHAVKVLYESPLGFGKFRRKQLISRLISSMSHKAKGLSRNRGQNKERSFAYNERQRIFSVFSILREARGNGRTFVTQLEQVSKYCNC